MQAEDKPKRIMVSGLSHPRAITRIPDPIHRSFELTLFDRDIVDTGEFQRLHFILQQSTMYASFPANKNTRFPHSIGTAHVACKMFSSALSNAETDTLRGFLEAAADFLEKLATYLFDPSGMQTSGTDYFGQLKDAHRATISGMSRFLHRPLMPSAGADAVDLAFRVDTNDGCGEGKHFDVSFVIDTLWQALRIYALAHDIGHLPMSHAFEHGLARVDDGMSEYGLSGAGDVTPINQLGEANKRFSGSSGLDQKFFRFLNEMIDAKQADVEFVITKKEIHEIRSYGILNDYLVKQQNIASGFDLSDDLKTSVNRYCSFIHHLALCIIYSICREQTENPDPGHQFLFAMRQLVDGKIDGDRLDYTLRDCHSSGVDFGRFDLGRIIDNALLLKPVNSNGDTAFVFGFGPRAVAGIEQFFEARYQSYKYLVHHRTSSRSNKAVEALVEKLFIFAYAYPDSECARLMEHYEFLRREKNKKGKAIKVAELLPVQAVGEESYERLDDVSLRSLMQDVRKLFRDKKNLRKISKDRQRYSLALELRNLCDVILDRKFNHILTLFKEHSPDSFLAKELGMGDPVERKLFLTKLGNEAALGRFFERLRKTLVTEQLAGQPEPISIMYDLPKEKTFSALGESNPELEKVVWVQRPSGRASPIGDEDISPGLGNMSKSRAFSMRLRVYACARDIKSTKELVDRAKAALKSAVEHQRAEWGHDNA